MLDMEEYKPGSLSLFLNPDVALPSDIQTRDTAPEASGQGTPKTNKTKKTSKRKNQKSNLKEGVDESFEGVDTGKKKKTKKKKTVKEDTPSKHHQLEEAAQAIEALQTKPRKLPRGKRGPPPATKTPKGGEQEQVRREKPDKKRRKQNRDHTEIEKQEAAIKRQHALKASRAKEEKALEMRSKTPKQLRQERAKVNREDPRLPRTIFVGNVPTKCKASELKTIFKAFGAVESVRFRSVSLAEEAGKMPRRAAFNKGHLDSARDSMNAYVVFSEEQSAEDALALNGKTVLGTWHIRVDRAAQATQDNARSVFLGNLAPDTQEEDIRMHFMQCGNVQGVRLVRDAATNKGKGFGFVLFEDQASVKVALTFNNMPCKGRDIRVFKALDSKKLPKVTKAGAARKRLLKIKGKGKRAKKIPRRGGNPGNFQGEMATKPTGQAAAQKAKKRKHAARGKGKKGKDKKRKTGTK